LTCLWWAKFEGIFKCSGFKLSETKTCNLSVKSQRTQTNQNPKFKVSNLVGVISQRLRPITLTETLIILDITKTESNNCLIIHWTKKMEVMFLLLHWRQATQSARTLDDYPWPWVSLTWLFYNLQRWRHRCWFRKFSVCFPPIRKEIVSSMYNSITYYVTEKITPLWSLILNLHLTANLRARVHSFLSHIISE